MTHLEDKLPMERSEIATRAISLETKQLEEGSLADGKVVYFIHHCMLNIHQVSSLRWQMLAVKGDRGIKI